ncbi:zinc-ribbon domain-containing protein [Maridesulfovibrio sp. FT414]|uniref:zinc-ribbon domain-containing protein n=1 Tax=Maridesulfovibrio sp. FT414 TaxID=2979469 RepID=UPI003D802DCB
MKVTCPECNFSSEIPEDKIPANAQLATCPKCGIKFQFRELPPVEEQDTAPVDTPYYGEYEQQPEQADPAAYYEEQQQYGDDNYQQYREEDHAAEPEAEHNIPHEEEQPFRHEHIQAEEQVEDRIEDRDETPVRRLVREEPEVPREEKADIWAKLNAMRPKNTDDEDQYYSSMDSDYSEVPFEHLEKYGFFPGLFLTIKRIFLSPGAFFSNMELTGFIKPLIFFILLAEFQEICNFIWATTGMETSMTSEMGRMVSDSMIAESLKEGTASALFSLLLYPLMLAGLSFPLIGFTHIMLMIFGAGDRGYQATFRATAYSYAPIILSVIPVAGDFIGALLSMAISIIAYKHIHKTSYMRVVLSIVMPIVLLLVILGFYMNFNQPTI